MNGNDFVNFFLQTPFRVFLRNTMLITVKGRKTGKEHSTPVGYYRENGYLWVLSSRDRTLWCNVKGGAVVKLLLKGRILHAFAEAVLDEKVVGNLLDDYVRHIPMSARGLGIRIENEVPNAEDVSRLAKERMFVKITPR